MAHGSHGESWERKEGSVGRLGTELGRADGQSWGEAGWGRLESELVGGTGVGCPTGHELRPGPPF